MKPDNMPQVASFWNGIAADFDAIYTGTNKNKLSRFLDRFFRKDIYQRFDWVMQRSGDVRGKTICDIGCGSGRFVTKFAKRGAEHVTGVDVAPDMLKLAAALVERDGVAAQCDFALSDVLHWKTDRKFDITIAIGFWDYIRDPPGASASDSQSHQRNVSVRLAALLDLAHAGEESSVAIHSRLPRLFLPEAESN